MIAWNQLSAINCESLEEYISKFWDALLLVSSFKMVPLAEQIEKYYCGLPKGIKKYCTKISVINMARLMENAEVVDDLIQGKPDEDGFKTRCKEPQGKQFSAKGNVTSRLTVPPFKKKPFAGKQRQGFKRHFTGKTIEERKALRDAKKCYTCEGGYFANECPQRNSHNKDDKFDRKGKKPKPSARLVPDLCYDFSLSVCWYQPGNGFHVIAAHTDSPCPKLKPVSATSQSNETNYANSDSCHSFGQMLSLISGCPLAPLLFLFFAEAMFRFLRGFGFPFSTSKLALGAHSGGRLLWSVNTDGFKPNFESHLVPILATLLKTGISSNDISSKSHHLPLLQLVAKELHCNVEEIADLELNVCDTQPSCLGGALDEFVFSGRLDNLASSYCALRALLDTSKDSGDLIDETSVRMVALFDNEEVGSDSAQGAGSPTMFQAISRISNFFSNTSVQEGLVERSIRRSFLVSADMAHALHPNYSDRHEDHHQPKLHEGIVIKHNANQRYATTAATAFLFKEVAKARGIPTQNFVVRNDMGCGSTIGPILASGIGIRTVDCGIPQLSMHSVREICGTGDIDISYKHFKAFYELFDLIDRQLVIDG
ncbi:hypothetical protein L7F22_055964 [Adiantum nelumboides]|nr:hypothetical protein [Adiantum nelumboides]